jgi:hypothetical protein
MKIHLLSYNAQGLNMDVKVCKMNQFFTGMTLQMDIVCIHEHELHKENANNIGKLLWPNAHVV